MITIGRGVVTVNMFYAIRHTAKREGKRHGKIIHESNMIYRGSFRE